MLTFALALLLATAHPAQKPVWQEQREALDALRYKKPGDAEFDASLARLPELIASGSGAWVAGGAHLAGQYKRSECVPALLDALKKENERPAEGADFPKRAVLDALLRLDARVPVGLAMARPEREFANQVYLLLASDAEHGRDGMIQLLDLKWIDSTAHWASACALVDARDKRIAERLIAGWDWEFRVRVVKPGSALGGSIGRNGGGSSSHDLWPPRATYELELPTQDQPLQPIAFVRSEATRHWTLPRVIDVSERMQRRAQLLTILLRTEPESSLVREAEDLSIELSEGEAYETPLRTHAADLRERIGKLASALKRVGLIDEKSVLAPVSFRVRVSDYRDSPGTPLPAPPAIEGVTYEK